MSTPNLDRLPKWAREHITKLIRERDHAEQQFREYHDSQTKSRIYVAKNLRRDCQYIQGHTITFEVHPGREIDVALRTSELRISCNWGRLVVEPEVTNVITVKGERR